MRIKEDITSERKRLRKQIYWGPYVLLFILIFVFGIITHDSSGHGSSKPITYTEPFVAEQYSWDITYEDIARHPTTYQGQKIALKGKILQIIESSSHMGLRVAIDGSYDEIIYVYDVITYNDNRLLENDNIALYGICDGIQAYQSVLKTKISIPRIKAVKIEYTETKK